MSEITLKRMMEAGLHFGHQTKRWNPKMRKYIFDSRNGIYILDLQKTLPLLNKALAFARTLAAGGGKILFVGSKLQAKEILETEAKRAGMPYVTERWLGGMLTNFETIRKSVARLRQLEEMEQDGSFKVLAKKEVIRLQKEKDKLQKNLGGIKEMGALPGAVFIVDTKKERIALAEAIRLRVPVIAIVDTNCDPDGIEFPVPGNDDATRAIELVTHALSDALMDGAAEYAAREKAMAEERERVAVEKRRDEEQRRAEETARRKAAKAAKAEAGSEAQAESQEAGAQAESQGGQA
ncbi:MAG: 30S ribosomal protein S2 [Nitrospinae bacterium]|nr:30S ribosomal protein S2 [Nitrospinota bacterium]